MMLHERGRVLRRALLAVTCLISAGCGGSSAEIYPVRGEVYLNGQPAAGALVHFHPVDGELCSPAFATVNEDGSFELSTYGKNDGAEPGDYIVTLNWRDEQKVDDEFVTGPDRFKERYSKPKVSELKVTVIEGENLVPRYDLTE